MDPEKDSHVQQFKWHIVVVGITLAAVIALALFTRLFENTETLRNLVFLLGSLIFLGALLAMLARVSGIVETLRDNSAKMAEAAKALEDIRSDLIRINHSTRVSDTVKAIAFREEDRQSLREAVFEKLKQRDFDGAYEIIDEIGIHSGYRTLAVELRQQVDGYRNATEDERIDQAIEHIKTHFRNAQWARASIQIEALIKEYPSSEKAKAMRQQLLDHKEERKRILMAAWDDAVQQGETDRSLEILRELDMYLTPNEGLALQEAAKDVFKTKLHNLGVQFAMAISNKEWDEALEVGQQIIRDFPNSRMSTEIKEKLKVIAENKEGGRAARYADFTLKQVERFELACTVAREVELQSKEREKLNEKIGEARQVEIACGRVGDLVQNDHVGKLDLLDQQVDQRAVVAGSGDLSAVPQEVGRRIVLEQVGIGIILLISSIEPFHG